jgi:hypothetical protein
MLRDGVPIEQIVKWTNLSWDEVEALRQHQDGSSSIG